MSPLATGMNGPELLKRLDPAKARKRCPSFDQLFAALERLIPQFD